MAGPWEKFKKPDAAPPAQGAKPWEKFGAKKTESTDDEDLGITPHPDVMPMTEVLSRGLNMLGGISRAAILGNADDMEKAKVGLGPSTKEYIERAGMKPTALSDVAPGAFSPTGDEWFKLKKGGWADLTDTGAAGFAGDVVMDPATYAAPIAKGLKAVPLMGRFIAPTVETVLNPIGKLISKGGEKFYKGAFSAADAEANALGKTPVSDVLFEHGVKSTDKNLMRKVDKLVGKLTDERNEVLKDASGRGARVNWEDVVKKPRLMAQELQRSPETAQMANEFITKLGQYEDRMGPTDLMLGSQIKSDLYDVAAPVFNPNASASQIREWQKMHSVFGGVLGDELAAKSGVFLGPEAQQTVLNRNAQLSPLLSTRKVLDSQAKSAMKNPWMGVSPTDVGLGFLGGLIGHDPVTGIKVFTAKKAIDAARSRGGRTYLGRAAYQAGRFGGAYPKNKIAEFTKPKDKKPEADDEEEMP